MGKRTLVQPSLLPSQDPSSPSRAAIYLRVSTDEQAKSGLGLEAQEERCRAYALVKGWSIFGIYTDPGVSGSTEPRDRRAFAELLRDLEAGSFDVVIVLKLDRLVRRVVWCYQTIAHLEAKGCAFVSASEGFDTSVSLGRLMMGILATFAEFDVDRIRERTREALAAKKVRRERIGAAYYGIRVTDQGEELDVPIEREAIARIVALRRQGKPLREIAYILTQEEVPTKRGGRWAPATIAKVLQRAESGIIG